VKEKLIRFFSGRCGCDSLGYALIVASLVINIVSSFTATKFGAVSVVMWILSNLLLCYAVFRMFSRNIYARRRENELFTGWTKPVKKWFKLQKNKLRDRKTHKYFACPKCKNNLRVPKGRGEITVTCPVCKTKFDKRT